MLILLAARLLLLPAADGLARGLVHEHPVDPAFRLASTFGDGMVLAAAPKQAMVWGFCEPGATVTVALDGAAAAATVGPDHATGNATTWRALLPATAAGFTNHTVTATDGKQTLSLAAVLFGEVWVCSGQSNMEYPIGSADCWDDSNVNCTMDPRSDGRCGSQIDNYTVYNAALANGHDLVTKKLTWQGAMAYCNATAACFGFTFEARDEQPASPVDMYFKQWNHGTFPSTDPSGVSWYFWVKGDLPPNATRPCTSQCSYGCSQNAGAEIAAMANYDDGMRLFAVESNKSQVPQADLLGGAGGSSGWLEPSAMGGQFSAACWCVRQRPGSLVHCCVGERNGCALSDVMLSAALRCCSGTLGAMYTLRWRGQAHRVLIFLLA
jgi:hypothetical protein